MCIESDLICVCFCVFHMAAYGTLHMWEMGAPCAPQTAPGKCPTQNAAGLAMIEHAMSLGITTFDLASNYRQQPQLFGARSHTKLRDCLRCAPVTQ